MWGVNAGVVTGTRGCGGPRVQSSAEEHYPSKARKGGKGHILALTWGLEKYLFPPGRTENCVLSDISEEDSICNDGIEK